MCGVMMLPKEFELQVNVLRLRVLSLLSVEKGNTNF